MASVAPLITKPSQIERYWSQGRGGKSGIKVTSS